VQRLFSEAIKGIIDRKNFLIKEDMMPVHLSKPVELLIDILNSPPVKNQAYLDPGSGSFIIQVLIASLVGIGFALRGYWGKFLGLFQKKANEEDTGKADETSDEE